MSLPLIHDPIVTYSSSQGDQTHYRTTIGQMTKKERDAKIEKFQEDLPDLLRIQKQLLPLKEGIINIYYFIGRLNPPHDGHIKTLQELVQRAINENPGNSNSNYKIIILLGSGPKNGNPLDNPLSFETKREFITYKLKQLFPDNPPNFIFDQNVEILEMKKAPEQITEITRTTLPLVSNLIEEINMYRFSGAKDGDDEKLNWIETTIRKILKDYPDKLSTHVVPVQAVFNEENSEAMSATDVRLSILRDFLEDTTNFFRRYEEFYGDEFSRKISQEIRGVAEKVGNPAVQQYISKKGGSRKTRSNRSKRRKTRRTKRRKTKYQKTKRKLTKRRKTRRN